MKNKPEAGSQEYGVNGAMPDCEEIAMETERCDSRERGGPMESKSTEDGSMEAGVCGDRNMEARDVATGHSDLGAQK